MVFEKIGMTNHNMVGANISAIINMKAVHKPKIRLKFSLHRVTDCLVASITPIPLATAGRIMDVHPIAMYVQVNWMMNIGQKTIVKIGKKRIPRKDGVEAVN